MGWNDEALYDQYEDQEPESGAARPQAVARVEPSDSAQAERARRLKFLEVLHAGEFEEWLRVRPLLNVFIDFGADHEFDFGDFLQEVGRRPSENHTVARVDKAKPYQQGNMAWVAKVPEVPRSPYLNVEEAAAYLGVAVQTIYNNRKHIPALPGFRTLMFDPKKLDEVRASTRFKTQRLTGQRRRKATS